MFCRPWRSGLDEAQNEPGGPADPSPFFEPLKSRIVFMGTAELACASLEALAAAPEFEVVAVVTQPDRPKGRALKLQPSPVKAAALRAGLPVLQPERARDPAFLEELRRLEPDLIVVAAYGQLLPSAILTLPPLGCLNVHASLLPKYRGAAPIQWAILNDESETGVTIMKWPKNSTPAAFWPSAPPPLPPGTPPSPWTNAWRGSARNCWPKRWRNVSTIPSPPVPQIEAEATSARKITKARRPPRLVATGPFLVESRPRLRSVAGRVHLLAGRREIADGQNLARLGGGKPRRRARRSGASGQGGNCRGLRRRRRIAHSRIATRRRPPFDRRGISRRPPLAARRPAGVKRDRLLVEIENRAKRRTAQGAQPCCLMGKCRLMIWVFEPSCCRKRWFFDVLCGVNVLDGAARLEPRPTHPPLNTFSGSIPPPARGGFRKGNGRAFAPVRRCRRSRAAGDSSSKAGPARASPPRKTAGAPLPRRPGLRWSGRTGTRLRRA